MRGKIKLRWFGVLVILILLGMAAVQINAKVLDTTTQTTVNNDSPEICCSGSISWFNVKPGQKILDNFEIINCGEEGSFLDWEIFDWPTWGKWDFHGWSGKGLPVNEWRMIKVYITAPEDPGTEYTGKIKVKNSDDPSDFCSIDISIALLKTHQFVENYPIMYLVENYLSSFP